MKTIQNEIEEKLAKVSTIFKEEMSEMHKQIITGSPVRDGHFKTSWQLLEYDIKLLKFSLHNNVEYGMKLWRYKGSKKGWSPTGGDRIVMKAEREMSERFNNV